MTSAATLESDSPAATQTLGERLGRLLEAGDVVALLGDLGAGKTAFVQGVARGLDVTSARVASPTFTIVNEHPGRVPLYHIDLYRLVHADELFELGFQEYLGGDGVAVVEWFDRFPDEQPAERLEIRIEITGEQSRRLRATAHGARAAARLERWIG
ncbi:MAG: tRNA threonylcarbamoyladenosine biosynthesis protein TsaE [Myxococcales bacterium]|nr:tRNA threonylcarbamoyladenosine biosynthesis protein TsaE [Myxococcales bacterium]